MGNSVSESQPLKAISTGGKPGGSGSPISREEDELTFEEFNALLDMEVKDEGEARGPENLEKRKPEKTSSSYQPEDLLEQPEDKEKLLERQDETDEMLIAYKEARKAYMAIEAQLSPLLRENFKINRRMEEIILHDMKEAGTREEIDALKREFDGLKRRHDEISSIIDELIAEQKRVKEEFEMRYGISFSEAYLKDEELKRRMGQVKEE
ncbi:hypothetical protein J7M22_07780 [Candidatus Poribacteria bacterium]|nr:hypothetical protein [Candidatus Poribacteria bacterium]